MPVAVTVQIKDKGTFAYLKGLSTRAKKIGPRETWNLTQFGAREIRESHERTSEEFEGKISGGIRARKLKTATYGIFIPQAGIMLDSMSTHWVSLKRGRTITRWAKKRGITAKAIQVSKHPFIDAGYQRMLNRLDIVANRIANGIVGT